MKSDSNGIFIFALKTLRVIVQHYLYRFITLSRQMFKLFLKIIMQLFYSTEKINDTIYLLCVL